MPENARAFTDLMGKDLTVLYAWGGSSRLPVTLAQLMRHGIG